MTVASTTRRVDYVGNGATAAYDYTFRIFAKTDLAVTKTTDAGVETTLVVDTDYTVTGVGAVAGGTITLTAGALTSGYALTIRRVRPLTQLTDLRNQGESFREIHEDAMDNGVMIAQQQQEQIDRCLKLPTSEAPTDDSTVLPAVDDRAGKVLGFDDDGNLVAVVDIPDLAVTISAFIETLLDDASAATARTTLGVDRTTLQVDKASSKGITGARPVVGTTGFYFNTTTNTLQRDNGATWDDVSTIIPVGTKMVFFQAAVPVGWSQDTSQNDKALRVVSGTGAGTGGSTALSSGITLAHSHNVASHTHTIAHIHDLEEVAAGAGWSGDTSAPMGRDASLGDPKRIYQAVTAGSTDVRFVKSVTQAASAANSGAATPATDSAGSNITLAYVDVIIGTKL